MTRASLLSSIILFAGVVVPVAPACGGGTHPSSAAPGTERPGHDLDIDELEPPDAGVPDAEPPAPPPAVMFELHNAGTDELVFSLDLGWQPVLFAFSGKPPKATSILMFAKHCTAACEVDEADRCPHCPRPEGAKKQREAAVREVVAPGETLEVPWDAEVFVYEKTRGTRNDRAVRCECYTKEPVLPETYTVRACGLRLTTQASTASKLQCADATMTVPSDEPQVVRLEFPAPPPDKKKRR
jgi:hypothetical protein